MKTVSSLVQRNPMMRSVVTWFIKFTLNLLESQRLIDTQKLNKTSIDWDRGIIDFGDGFTEQLVARTFSQWVIDKKKDDLRFKAQAIMKKKYGGTDRSS